ALFEERDRLRHLVVRAQDRGVAAGRAGADVAALEHADVGDAVARGEVVGGREAVPAAADHDHVVARARFRRAQVLALAQEPGHRATTAGRSRQTAGRRSRRWWETTEETVTSRSSSRTTTLAGTCATSPCANPPGAGSGIAERRANASRRSSPRTIQVAYARE